MSYISIETLDTIVNVFLALSIIALIITIVFVWKRATT